MVACGLLAACEGGGDAPDARPAPDAYVHDADVGVVPRVEPAACRFVVPPGLGLAEGTDYACGDLVVEENRATHEGRIRLHYARFASAAATNRATIYLDGGPGGDGQGILNHAGRLGLPFLQGLLADGDFLVLGQRGTALAKPSLECGQSCGNLSQVADLASYNTAYNADDVDDLRAVLGLEKLNLYGISYGSRLALEVLRRHGDHVRAAVIEGLVPPQVVWTAAIPSSFHGALLALDASCQNAGACGTMYGDLVAKFLEGVDSLNASPLSIPTPSGPVPLDGYSYAYIVFRVMYARSTYASLPLVINDVAIRRTDRAGSIVATWLDATSSDVSRGLYYSVVCGELYNPPTPNAVEQANSGVPQVLVDLFGASYDGLADTCETWPKGDLQAMLSQPVTSSVPTLVSSGRLDPITPPSFGTAAAGTLSNATVVVHEDSGHGATLQSACGAANLHAFLADPTTPHDTSCAATITTDYMLPGTFAGPTVSLATLRAELALAPVPPFVRDRLPPRRR